ncbi:hypothetical protein DWF00_16515 [Bosea caraganae]|uniref:Twin-arginine translocation signal domain-containing protein n=1 Tax=Bosea caraganae TaxID=2763117 RepID=A0A370KYQ6_9HYPH|nr:twin-arginine translocation signal domain-containing protein [Bosea caraganae]RDJ20114.1 hypothetical protein DWE98_26120 [Bosea caraganae]RDJ24826.1 hypothetical protein DWF00_16515 [Bosea caraganae]
MKATRRNFMAGAAAIAVTGAPALALAAGQSDPFLVALAEYEAVHAVWLAKLEMVSEANLAAVAEAGPAPSISFNGQTMNEARNDYDIDRFFHPFADGGRVMSEAKAKARRQVVAWRAANYAAGITHRVDELQDAADEDSSTDSKKLDAAFATVPTTKAGFVAYLDLMDREWEYLAGRASGEPPMELKTAFLALCGDAAPD